MIKIKNGKGRNSPEIKVDRVSEERLRAFLLNPFQKG
jgi:hypothetical protein